MLLHFPVLPLCVVGIVLSFALWVVCVVDNHCSHHINGTTRMEGFGSEISVRYGVRTLPLVIANVAGQPATCRTPACDICVLARSMRLRFRRLTVPPTGNQGQALQHCAKLFPSNSVMFHFHHPLHSLCCALLQVPTKPRDMDKQHAANSFSLWLKLGRCEMSSRAHELTIHHFLWF